MSRQALLCGPHWLWRLYVALHNGKRRLNHNSKLNLAISTAFHYGKLYISFIRTNDDFTRGKVLCQMPQTREQLAETIKGMQVCLDQYEAFHVRH